MGTNMDRKDSYDVGGMKGVVRGCWVGSDGRTQGAFVRRNQLSYGCADAIAQLMAGNSAYVPKYIGFLYGTSDAPAITSPTLRTQSWAGLDSELASIGGNIQIVPLSLTPSISVDGDIATYTGNSVAFSAETRSGATGVYGFPTSGAYADVLDTGSYIYHAVLLTRLSTYGVVSYLPLARVSLQADDSSFLQKPTGLELALRWQVSFF